MRIIAGEGKGFRLAFPRDRDTRPLTDRIKESLFATLGERIPGAAVLDVYAGCGSFGLEALSREADRAVFVEQGADAIACLKKNLVHTGLEDRARIHKGDAWRYIRKATTEENRFDIIFMDPPFERVTGGDFGKTLASNGSALVRIASDTGLLVIRIPSRTGTVAEPAGFVLDRSKRYGRSTVLIYEKKEGNLPPRTSSFATSRGKLRHKACPEQAAARRRDTKGRRD